MNRDRQSGRALRIARLAPLLLLMTVSARPMGPTFFVVDVIPSDLASETGQNAEPSLAVSAAAPNFLAASVWTPGLTYCHGDTAVVFTSPDNGTTWNPSCVLPRGGDFQPQDMTVRLSSDAMALYVSSMNAVTTGTTSTTTTTISFAQTYAWAVPTNVTSEFTTGTIAGMVNGGNLAGFGRPLWPTRTNTDQPQFVSAPDAIGAFWVSNNRGSGTPVDSCQYVSAKMADDPISGTPAVFCLAKERPPVSTFPPTPGVIPASRGAMAGGKAYVIMYRTVAANVYDVVVYRRDPSGADFNMLSDGTATPGNCAPDGLIGVRVARCVNYPFLSDGSLPGGERRIASEISIAVDPGRPDTVYVAWAEATCPPPTPSAPSTCTTSTSSPLSLHFASSIDGGRNWTPFSWTFDQATNPALAVDASGNVGILFQQLVQGGNNFTWQTKFVLGAPTGLNRNRPSTTTLVSVDASSPRMVGNPYLGDYLELHAVGTTFYGIFSASNNRKGATFNFECSTTACPNQRPHDTNGPTDNSSNHRSVKASIDPFFFRVAP